MKKNQELNINKEEIAKEIIQDVKKSLDKEKNILKNEIIQDVRNQVDDMVKSEIKDNIVMDVNNEIKDNMTKVQKMIIRNKNFKIFKKNMIILIFTCIIIYFVYCLWDARYFWFMKDKEKTVTTNINNPETVEEVEEIVKDKNWYITNYGYLLDYMKLDLSYDNPNIYYLYNGNFDRSTIKDTIKLNLVYKFIENKNETDYNYTINEEDMKNAYIKLFGSIDNYNPTSFTVGCMQFYYNNIENIYTAYKFVCDSTNSLQIKEEIKDIYEKDNKIIIETVMGVYDSNNKYLFNYSNLYLSIENNFENDRSIMEYEDKLNSYRYVFNEDNNNIYFESIEKIK